MLFFRKAQGFFCVTCHAAIRLLLVLDITLDVSSVKRSGTRQPATLQLVSSGILGDD